MSQHRPLLIRCYESVMAVCQIGFLGFGGPHIIGLLLSRGLIDDQAFMELYAVANCQPGPNAGILTFSVVSVKYGILPAILAVLVISLPGAIVMGMLGYAISELGSGESASLPNWLLYLERSLASVSIGLVISASKLLASKVLVDNTSISLATLAVVALINFSGVAWLLVLIILFGGLVTWLESEIPTWFKSSNQACHVDEEVSPLLPEPPNHEQDTAENANNDAKLYTLSMNAGIFFVVLALFVLIVSAVIHEYTDVVARPIIIFTTFYFYGGILFSGAIPILYSYLVAGNHWLTPTEFMIGYAVNSILPGFGYNFAAYAGALAFRGSAWTSFIGALFAMLGFYSPGLTLNAGLLPAWKQYRQLPLLKKLFKGLTSVSLGLMMGSVFLLINKAISLPGNQVAALIDYPGWTALTIIVFVLMDTWKIQAWWVILGGAVIGILNWVIDGRP